MVEFEIIPRAGDDSWGKGWPPSGYPADWLRPLSDLDRSDFTLRFFHVDLRLSVNGVDLGISALELPALDLALMFKYAKDALAGGEVREIEVETTLSRHRYRLTRHGDETTLLEVVPDRGRSATMPTSDFEDFVDDLLAGAVGKIIEAHPPLMSNSYLRGLLAA